MARAGTAAEPQYEEHRLLYQRPYLYPKQEAAIFDPRRYSVIEASTKAGKTAGCIVWLLEQAFKGKDGQNFWWIAPVSFQAAIAFKRAVRAVAADLISVNQTDKTITTIMGTVIWFKSADKPDSLYGEDVHAAVVDEASRVKSDAWIAVRSTLTATRGHVRIIGNVKGRKNWFYDIARVAQKGDDKDLYGYHKMTAYDAAEAGVLEQSEIEDAKRVMPAHAFRELYLAEPAEDGGNPFGLSSIDKCVDRDGLSTGEPLVWGWDLAKSVDWTVGVALDANGRVCRFVRLPHGMVWPEIEAIILRETGRTPALVDSTGVGSNTIDHLQRARPGVFEGFNFTVPSKQLLMEGLVTAVQSQSVHFPAKSRAGEMVYTDPGHLQDELESFEYEYTRTGVRYSAPVGYYDDCVMALALAVLHRSQARLPLKVSKSAVASSAARGARNGRFPTQRRRVLSWRHAPQPGQEPRRHAPASPGGRTTRRAAGGAGQGSQPGAAATCRAA